MLTHLTISNFKRFESVEIELGSPVVFIGPQQLREDLGDAGAGIVGHRPEALEREVVGPQNAGETTGGGG